LEVLGPGPLLRRSGRGDKERPASCRFDEAAALVLACEQGAQSGEAVGGGHTGTRQFGEAALDEGRQETRRRDDLVEERGALPRECIANTDRFGAERLGSRPPTKALGGRLPIKALEGRLRRN